MTNPDPHRLTLSPDALAWREWDGDVVVFNGQTGSTHLLSELGSEVFRWLMAKEHGATAAALAAELADDPADAATDWTAAVAEVLSEFARLGLAHPDKS